MVRVFFPPLAGMMLRSMKLVRGRRCGCARNRTPHPPTRSRPEHVHGLEQPGSEGWHNHSTGPAVQIGTRCCNSFAKQFLARNFCNVPPTAAGENGTCEVKNYVKRVDCISQTTKSSREVLTGPSSMDPPSRGVGFSAEHPLPTTFIRKNHRAVSTRAPSGESFAATTNLRLENQSPNLHKRRIATSAP